ncbi:PfaD family polyunsaturated fatty acid/polyketide biosynthesis protein [Bradyrhizobium sp. OK095]|uniref:PfaD family polyunsaturated fatty acid/polyketide biosynthesis protein n=1 Tax=Bradyrhizobium sp. OK095 TaxID=1882760 RepID=UPI0008BE0997|nr:PfaD family polyunsaturated fatty acid/polyketide biosynthesis protein [Bradyrhizobium sp. OK095]SEO17605.1 trans-AT polyketide synthase, acyltransferase and oxidoreductase domain-containing protein [Bradyrhizobium sp. OK095]
MLQTEAHHEAAAQVRISAARLGSEQFKSAYGIKYAYLAGAMYKGIASKEVVVAMAKAGLMGYLGTGGLRLDRIESDIRSIQSQLPTDGRYGMNLLSDLSQPELEQRTVELLLRCGVRFVEAAAYMQVSPSLVRYRSKGLKRRPDGRIEAPHRVMAKISRPEVATAFMQPAPEAIIRQLVQAGHLSVEEADLSRLLPVASEICVEADSGGHTDRGVAHVLMPVMLSLRDEMMAQHGYAETIHVGAAGGIGTPEAAAAAFVMGADFILTGSINQCTVEAGTSVAVKDMLETAGPQDTAYAPAGDMFELGAKVQVFKKGIFFPARANKLYELYSRYNSLDEIDLKTRRQIEEKYFRRSFDDIWQETKSYYLDAGRGKLEELERSPKLKMALIFRWYFVHTTRLAMNGDEQQKLDYQIHCGPALGAFNRWVKGTALESWRNRHVADIAERLLNATADRLNERFAQLTGGLA